MKAYIEPLVCGRCKKEYFPKNITVHSSRRRICDDCRLTRNAENCIAYRENGEYVTTGAHIRKDQKEFLDKHFINFSKFVRIKIDEEINKYER